MIQTQSESHAKLLVMHSQSVHPGSDDKVLTGWNGLMQAALAESARVLGNDQYLRAAQENADFLLSNLRPYGKLRRSWRKGQITQQVRPYL